MITKKELKRLEPAEITKLHICPFCGGEVKRKSKHGPMPSYCSRDCQLTHNNKDLSDGAAIIKLAKAWRESRGSGPVGSASFREMTAAIDVMLESDRKSGRPSALFAAAVTLQDPRNYQDRRQS